MTHVFTYKESNYNTVIRANMWFRKLKLTSDVTQYGKQLSVSLQ